MLLLAGFVLFTACEKENEGNETKISQFNSDESHNAGQNCMLSHVSGGEGEGWFTVAGTIYDSSLSAPAQNATVTLTTAASGGGTVVATLEADQLGNFYTTENVSFAEGLYAMIEGEGGTKKYMSSSLSSGKCNSCHGSTVEKLSID